jgi:hypothetical protein
VRDDDRVGTRTHLLVADTLVDADEEQVDRPVDARTGRRRLAEATLAGELIAVVIQQQIATDECAPAEQQQ